MTELTAKYRALAAAITEQLGERVQPLGGSGRELGYALAPGDLLECCRLLRDSEALGFEMLMDLSGVDYLGYDRSA